MAQTAYVTELPWSALPYALPSSDGPDFDFDFSVNAVLPASFQDSIFLEITPASSGMVSVRQVYSVGDDGLGAWVEFFTGVPIVIEVLPKAAASGFVALRMSSWDGVWGLGTATKLYTPIEVPFWVNSRGQREVL
jgi:hypothetical protein